MKARVILTGDIIDVTQKFNPNAQHAGDNLYVCGNTVYRECQLDFNCKDNTSANIIDWEQRRYELAKAAMQGLLANSDVLNADDVVEYKGDYSEKVAYSAVCYADALIKELKGE